MIINLYVVYDKVQDVSTNISYANSDIEAYAATQSFIKDKISKDDSYSLDDFELVCVGSFDRNSGLIEPCYRIVTNSVISSFKDDLKSRREAFLKEVDLKFKK